MPTYSDRMAIGTAAAIRAGVDPKLAPFVASQYAPPEVAAPNVWNRPEQDTPFIVQGVKNFGNSLREAGGFPSTNPLAGVTDRLSPAGIWGAYNKATAPIQQVFAGLPQEVSRLFETPAEANVRRAAAAKATPQVPSVTTPQGAPGLSGTSQAVQPQNIFNINGMVDFARGQGATVTSIKRDPAKNAKVGGVSNSFHLTGQAFDSTPPKGMSMAAWEGKLRQQFGGNADIINEGDHVHVEPKSRTQQVADAYMPNFVNPFDPTYFNKALGEVNRAGAAALTPETFSFNPGLAPEMPDPILPERTDFSKADAALAKLEPAVLDEKQLQREKRANFFQGLATAMANIPDGAGLGKVLGMLGAGALGGAAAGNKAVQDRLDAFDEKMARYNLAVYNHEGQKAQRIAEEARYEAGTLNQFGMQQWKTNYEQWAQNAQPAFSGDAMITRTVDPKTGQMTIKRTPIAAAVMAETAYKRAQIFTQMGGAAAAGANLQANAVNGMLGSMAGVAMSQDMQAAQGSQGTAADSVLTSAVFQAGNIVDSGQAAGLVGEDAWKDLTQRARQQAMAMYPEGGTAMNEAIRSYLVTELAKAGMIADKSFREKFAGAADTGLQFYAADKFRERTSRTSRDAKGRVTTSVTE